MAKEKRFRVAPEDVRNNAREGAGGVRWFKLPEGIRLWVPEKAGTYTLDILPYVIKSDSHPDRHKPGAIWWKYPFLIHRNVGSNAESIVCPASFGKRCPVCEEKARLAKNWDDNEEFIKAMRAQKFVAYCIKDPDDEDKVAVFAWSRGKFAEALEKELEEGGDDILGFFDVTDAGRSLKVRFSEETFEKNKFLQATRIDFVPRAEMDEDEVLAKTPCLDEIFSVQEYEPLKKLFLQIEDGDEAPSGTPSGKGSGKSGGTGGTEKTTAKGKPAPKDEPDEDKKGDDDGAKFEDGDSVSFKWKGETKSGKVIDVDVKGETYTVEVGAENDKEYDVDFDDVSEPIAEKKEAKKADKKAATPPPAAKFKVGDSVKDDDGMTGVITKIKGDDVTFKTAKGKEVEVDIDDVTLVEPEADDDDDDKPEDDVPLAVDDKVSWEDGDQTGVVVKVMSDGERVKVKNDDDGEIDVYNMDYLTKVLAKKKK